MNESTTAEKPAAKHDKDKKGTAKLAPRVFIPSAVIVLAVVIVALVSPDTTSSLVSTAGSTVIDTLGWYYVILTFGFIVFCGWLALSRFGEITLGKDDEKPEFSTFSWFAMLFSAGMGIGLMFWGVAEPLNHYASPPPGVEGSEAEVASAAMGRTFLHWGVHAWAIYVVVGLAVAYAVHRRGLPVSIRWALQPLLGDRVKGWLGDVIDVVAIVGTLFGVATSLGFGVSQVGAGLTFLGFTDENSAGLQVVLIIGITLIATASVVSGLGAGMKWLSNINLSLAAVLLLAVIILGPTLFLFRDFVEASGYYLQNFISMSFSTLPYQGEPGEAWLGGWTTYYWGWWMSWSPFVGIFIARISRGRTVREFIVGVLLVPTLLTMTWFVALGGSALYSEVSGDGGFIVDGAVSTDTALFQLLESLPGGPILSGMALLMIVVFFVTSSDSGSFVVDMIAHGGDPNPPTWSRVFFAVLEGSIAGALIWSGAQSGETGGLAAMQTLAILVAAPFSIIMVLAAISTAKALRAEHKEKLRLEHAVLLREIANETAESLTTGQYSEEFASAVASNGDSDSKKT